MKELNERFGDRMQELIRESFIAESLSKYAIEFVENKLLDTMTFGRLTYLHYHMFNGEGADIEQAAAAVELFILASDILDDLEDGDAPSKPWMNIPQPLALHVATALLTLSQQALLRSVEDAGLRGELAVMMNNQLLQSSNGQMIDLVNDITDEQSYLSMVTQKSGALMVFTCMTGVMLAGRPWNETVAQYAIELGISAQIRNDVRDLLRWDEKSDFLQRKRTLLTIYLLDEVQEQNKWISDYYNGHLTHNDIANKEADFQEACVNSGTILYGSVMGRMHYNKFEQLLTELPADTCWKDDIMQVLSGS